MPAAPVRFSTSTDWPQLSVKRWPTSRAMVSAEPPAPNGTMMRIGLAGNCWAAAGSAASGRRAASVARLANGFTSIGMLQSGYGMGCCADRSARR